MSTRIAILLALALSACAADPAPSAQQDAQQNGQQLAQVQVPQPKPPPPPPPANAGTAGEVEALYAPLHALLPYEEADPLWSDQVAWRQGIAACGADAACTATRVARRKTDLAAIAGVACAGVTDAAGHGPDRFTGEWWAACRARFGAR